MSTTRIYNFDDHSRREPPPWAEQHRKSDFTEELTVPSRYAPGKEAHAGYGTICPACKAPISIEHGDRLLCECGLYMENYGNLLTIWKAVPPKEEPPQ